MMQAVKENWWPVKKQELAWRPIGPSCQLIQPKPYSSSHPYQPYEPEPVYEWRPKNNMVCQVTPIKPYSTNHPYEPYLPYEPDEPRATYWKPINRSCVTVMPEPYPNNPVYPPYERDVPQINIDTRIILAFDASGSMRDVKPYLDQMIGPGGELRQKLIQYYDNSDVLFEDRVSISLFYDERFLEAFRKRVNDNSVIIVIQDESEPPSSGDNYYYTDPFSDRTTRNSYKNDRNNLIQKLNSYSQNERISINLGIIQIISTFGPKDYFYQFLKAAENGTGDYYNHKLSDIDNFKIKYEAERVSNQTYYKDLVVSMLNNFGYNV